MATKETQPGTDVEDLFTDPAVTYIYTARNKPDKAVVVSNRSGNYQLHAVDFENGFKRQVTDSADGTLFGSISANGEYIYTLKNDSGSEHGHFNRIPFSDTKEVDITPEYENYSAYAVSDSNDGDTVAMRVTVGGRNRILISNLTNGDQKTDEIYSTENSLSEVVCAPDGTTICCSETVSEEVEQLLFHDLQIDGEITRSKSFSSITPLMFSDNGKDKLLCLTQTSNWQRPCIYTASTDKIDIISNPDFKGDVWVLNWNTSNNTMILCDVYQAEQKLYLYNTENKELERIGPKSGSFNFHFSSAAVCSDNSIIVPWSNFNTSPRLIKIASKNPDKWKELSDWSGNISSNYDVESIHISSNRKEMVQAWVVKPEDSSGPLPFVIDVHGGPHGVTLDEFSPKAQSWIRNGFGYCAVNYHGSISFGEEFRKKIYGNPGYWETEDVVAVRNWLNKNLYADPDNIILQGWSWGGFVTLLALGKYPHLWRAGIAGNAIADWIKQYEDESAYFKALDRVKFAGTPETNRPQYKLSSPITYAEDIEAPVFIIHGKNDARCPTRQIRHFINELKKHGKKFQVEWFDSGHTGGFTNTKLRTEITKKSLEFAKIVKNNPVK